MRVSNFDTISEGPLGMLMIIDDYSHKHVQILSLIAV